MWFTGGTGGAVTTRGVIIPGTRGAGPHVGVQGGGSVHPPTLVVIAAHGGVRVAHETLTLTAEITTLITRVPKTI